ncbi:MAG: Protease HtpX [Phycisphaerales bacterium]|nr:Protease HtpX [Phycisphaerales bacterium]MCK6476054.1 zinc metalloprotease HtpX [Phycisphaerales bacterium]
MVRMINNVKTALLLGSMMGIFLLVGAQYGQQGMTIALIFGGLMNLVAWFFSDKIAIAAMQGREVTPETGGELYRMVDELRQRAGLPMPRVYICPHDAPNAFATGRSPRKAAVAVTEGCLRFLSEDELRGVIGHELAHIKNRDTLTSCIAATIAGVLAYLAQWGLFLGGTNNREGSNPLVTLVTFIIAAVGAAMIKAMISRSREYVADADGARIAGSPDGLVSALRKLDAYSRQIPLVQPNPAQNSLFIVEPLVGSSLVNLFATHPPTEKRIAALMYGQ